MANMAVYVTSVDSPGPYDRIRVSFSVVVEGAASGWSGDVYVAWSDPADAINAAVRAAAVAVASTHSVTVSGSDVQRVFGGAMETVS